MLYPAILLPYPTYRLLKPSDVPAGWLLRRVEAQVEFSAQTSLRNGRQLVSATQLGSPALQFPRGLSVNLLGQFEVNYAGWQPATTEAQIALGVQWPLGQLPTLPTPDQMRYLARPAWDAYALDLAEIQGYVLATAKGNFTAHVCHAPSCWNYWHYEIRFWDERLAAWVNTPSLYPNDTQYRKVAEAIRQGFQEAGLAQPLIVAGAPAPWPLAMFDNAGPEESTLVPLCEGS